MSAQRVTVVGDGGWGTALALLLCGKGHAVRLWGAFPDYVAEMGRRGENVTFLPGIPLPEELELADDMAAAVAGAGLLVAAVPTQFMRRVLERLAPCCPRGVPVVSVAKGIEERTLLRPTQVVRDVLGRVPVLALSGPSHAEEVARGLPTTVALASRHAGRARAVQEAFMSQRFRVYTNTDVVGVELGGAVKNVIAIAAGICDGLGLGDNAKAALLTRGLAEMRRLGTALGARRATFAGLAGVGDLITTAISPYGRNRAVGVAIGEGHGLRDVLASMEQVAEGVRTTRSVRALARRHGVEMPITEQCYRVLFGGKDPRRAVDDLMRRAAKDEEA
ncbi:MAG: NAD(P)H-dependent glycerol-3-phosphate dehydrogenase [Candidatus Brocadiia bacterium]